MGRDGGSTTSKAAQPPTLPDWEKRPWLYYLANRQIIHVHTPDAKAALKRSWELLLTHLDPKQEQELRYNGRLTVQRPRKRIVVIEATWGNVNVRTSTPKGRTVRYCAFPTEDVPFWDTLLAKYLAVKYEWERFTKTAEKW